MMFPSVFIAAIQLAGVTGESLRARAFFDANNVKVGDPLVLTVDFLGEADFASLHPPALSREVDRADWKLDDASARTDTFRDARRLTYRVRPMREGVLWFPPLEFSYSGPDGEVRTVKSNTIPVHARRGADIVIDGMAESEEDAMPAPPPLVTDHPPLSDDDLFAWRKACAEPSADAFAAFGFPEAKMNEARCAVLSGDWRRALSVYSRLEWTVGQTPGIERGMVAALALRFSNPAAELPVWRQVGRPLLRHGWKGRIGIAGGGVAAALLLFWLLGRAIRAVACVAFALFFAVHAFGQSQDPFAEMERMHRQMRQRMNQMMSAPFGGGFSMQLGGEEREMVDITASVEVDKDDLRVGDPFNFIVSLDTPKGVSVGQVQITPSELFGMQVIGKVENLADAKSANPSNVVKRLAVPVRYDVPFNGRISFSVEGMVSGRTERHGGRFSFMFSNSFRAKSSPVEVAVKPLPSEGQPSGFGGIVAEKLRFTESVDITDVETNDIVQITYRLDYAGYLPERWMPEGAAFEWGRTRRGVDGSGSAEWRRYFVADGAAATPVTELVYYDPEAKRYRTVSAGGTKLNYR